MDKIRKQKLGFGVISASGMAKEHMKGVKANKSAELIAICDINVDKATGEKAYWGCGHKLLIDDFYSKLISGQRFELDGEQGIKAIEIISDIYSSNKIY